MSRALSVGLAGISALLCTTLSCAPAPAPAPRAAAKRVDTSIPPSASGAQPLPAAFTRLREREEVFEFTAKPAVAREGNGWVITFAVRGLCDATVAIVDGEGNIVRHLASGVLGSNAPAPFIKDSREQRVFWDGLTDDYKLAPAGCAARVSLGLNAEFERSLAWNPYGLSKQVLKATGRDGTTCVLDEMTQTTCGYVFGPDGRYLRTFFPPPAAKMEEVMRAAGYDFALTRWGDRAMIWSDRTSFLKSKKAPQIAELLEGAGKFEPSAPPARPADLEPGCDPDIGKYLQDDFYAKYPRVTADPLTEDIYLVGAKREVHRLAGGTGRIDPRWFPGTKLDLVSELHFGPDRLLYVRVAPQGYGRFLIRMTRDGELVPFREENMVPVPTSGYGGTAVPEAFKGKELRALYMGVLRHNYVHQRGLYVTPSGLIVAGVVGNDVAWLRENHLDRWFPPESYTPWKTHPLELGFPDRPMMEGSYVSVWDRDGNIVALNAVGETGNGHGVSMDRDGNIYAIFPRFRPTGPGSVPEGLVDFPLGLRLDRSYDYVSPLVKVNCYGGSWPVIAPGQDMDGHPAVEWAYYGVCGQRGPRQCSCPHIRWDMDRFARSWLPANHLYSVMVLDSNGNRIARLGRYGNVDDEGLRFAWVRALTVSDRALYAVDNGNRRILKARLCYRAEESAAIPPAPPVPAEARYAAAMGMVGRNDAAALDALLRGTSDLARAVDAEKMPLLNRACMTTSLACARALLERGAEIEAADSFGRRPLHCAAGWSTVEMVKLLLEKGADPKARTLKEKTALDFGLANSYRETCIERRKIVDCLRPLVPASAPEGAAEPEGEESQ